MCERKGEVKWSVKRNFACCCYYDYDCGTGNNICFVSLANWISHDAWGTERPTEKWNKRRQNKYSFFPERCDLSWKAMKWEWENARCSPSLANFTVTFHIIIIFMRAGNTYNWLGNVWMLSKIRKSRLHQGFFLALFLNFYDHFLSSHQCRVRNAFMVSNIWTR